MFHPPGQDSDVNEQVLVTTPIKPDLTGESRFPGLNNKYVLGDSDDPFPLRLPWQVPLSIAQKEEKVVKIETNTAQPDTTFVKHIVQTVPTAEVKIEDVPTESWFEPAVIYQNIVPPPDPPPSLVIETPELIILKSTYDGNAGGSRIPARGQTTPDSQQYGDDAYLLAHNYTLIYQLNGIPMGIKLK